MLGQLLPHDLGDIEHGVEIARAVEIDPVPQLRDAHADLALGRPDRAQGVGQPGAGQPDQRGLGSRAERK